MMQQSRFYVIETAVDTEVIVSICKIECIEWQIIVDKFHFLVEINWDFFTLPRQSICWNEMRFLVFSKVGHIDQVTNGAIGPIGFNAPRLCTRKCETDGVWAIRKDIYCEVQWLEVNNKKKKKQKKKRNREKRMLNESMKKNVSNYKEVSVNIFSSIYHLKRYGRDKILEVTREKT